MSNCIHERFAPCSRSFPSRCRVVLWSEHSTQIKASLWQYYHQWHLIIEHKQHHANAVNYICFIMLKTATTELSVRHNSVTTVLVTSDSLQESLSKNSVFFLYMYSTNSRLTNNVFHRYMYMYEFPFSKNLLHSSVL